MLRTPTSATFDFSGNQAGPGATIDEDEADLTVLEESLKSTDEYCKEIAQKLDIISSKNANAIRTVKPLMSRINKLKVQQNNIKATVKLVDDVKEYASEIKKLDKTLANNEEMKHIGQIENYCGALSKLASIRKRLVAKRLDGFTGLMKGLNGSIRDAEVTLKYDMIAKLKKLDESQVSKKSHDDDEVRLIKQIEYIYEYMKTERLKDLTDTIVRERSSHDVRMLKSMAPLKPPSIVKDLYYLYSGASKTGSPSFIDYCKQASRVFQDEAHVLAKLLATQEEASTILNLVSNSLLAEITHQAEAFGAFVASNKFTHCTLLYEVTDGLHILLSSIYQYNVKIPSELSHLDKKLCSEASKIFVGFFEFVNMRYHELVVPEHPNETLNNTFMMLVTRLNKYSMFRDQQLFFISKMKNGSWLPAYRPPGFLEIKTSSSDAQYLLSTFYSDVIEFSFFNLAEQFQAKMSEEDLGVMLLFNLDGLQNLLDSRSLLKGILGQQGISRVDRLKKKAIDKATTGWSDMTTKLMEASTKQGDSFNMSNKDMGKFVDEFTKSFNENYKKLQEKNLPPFFKKELSQNIRKMLGPAYRVFYMSVSQDPSAKSVLKHFKLSISDFEHKLVTLA
ncbi:hypothetical protein FOA43_003326 [Brettanomyces nanus]|uniref:Exocyst complex subunit Exo70 C-terminal domain-containing protein n=1 Tax=Eeniella nana TaxID=13502 RepID=A0A875RQ57_EENNA|nr:uncharacterized protein FOA43_003326 [Brettanomyces nanus]QPG75940.1 hypothetical protein FOA43_003326 [Brettanomyces nanus]